MTSFVKKINITLCLIAATLLTACLDGKDSETIVTNVWNPTVKSMTLENNTNVCSNLSGYSFTIDNTGQSDPELIELWKDTWYDSVDKDQRQYLQKPGIIFNPDSLPIGSVADSVKVKLTYSSPSSVKFMQYDADHKLCKVVNYADTQTVWFDDYAVTLLDIVAQDGVTRKNYFVKVNVHNSLTDTICWKTLTPEAFDAGNVIDQRVDTIGQKLYWYVTLTDGTQQVRTSELTGDVSAWSEPQTISASTAIDLSTAYNWNNKLFAVGEDQTLLCTADGTTWAVASDAMKFVSILGTQLGKYNTRFQSFEPDSISAIVEESGICHFANSADGINWRLNNVNQDGTSAVPADFPIKGFSRPISVAAHPNSGNTTSRLYIVGGAKADGTLTSSTWTCDGRSWAEFPQFTLPAMQGASIVQYTKNPDKPGLLWILQPGVMADGKVSRTLYFSENSGVTWKVAGKDFSNLADTDPIEALGCNSAFYAPNNWKIYFLGGINADGKQVSSIRTGQLPNLSFAIKR